MRKQFGAKPKKADIQKYENSPNWDGSKFKNLVDTTMSITLRTLPKLLYKQFCDKKDREPSKPLKVAPDESVAKALRAVRTRPISAGSA